MTESLQGAQMWRFTQKVFIEYSKFDNKQRDGALGDSW